MSNFARIHDIEVVDTEKLRFSDTRKTMQMSDGMKRVSSVVRSPVINFVEIDHNTFEQLNEMLGNESFAPILVQDDYSVRSYGDPVNFRHTLSGKDGNLRKFSMTVQHDYWKLMMDWRTQEITTYWDALDESSDGDPTALINYDKEAGVTQNGTVIRATENSQLIAGYLWWGDYSITMNIREEDINAQIDGEPCLIFRKATLSTINKSYYRLRHDQLNSQIIFEYIDDTPTTNELVTWDTDLDIGLIGDWFKLKVECRGNRFDFYVAEADKVFTHKGTAYHDQLTTGYWGFEAIGDRCNFDDITVELIKPITIDLPVGAYDIEELTMSSSTKLDDNTNADGAIKTVVAPQNVVRFKQSVAELGDPSGGEVKVFDSMGEDDLLDYLECHFKLNEGVGDQTSDSSKHNLTITESNFGTKWSSISYNDGAKNCYDFDAGSDRVYAVYDNRLASANPWTVGCWVNGNADTWYHGLIGLVNYSTGYNSLRLMITSDDRFRIEYETTGTDGYYQTPAGYYETGKWYFVVATWDGVVGSIPKLYIDGELHTGGTYAIGTGSARNIERIYIGYGIGIVADAKLDDGFIFSKVLSAERIKWFYENMPSLVDESQWRRVFQTDHKVVGNIVISNGLIRLIYEKASTQIITGVYANRTWEEITFLPDWSSLSLENINAEVIELERYSATLREACYYQTAVGFDMVWTDYTIRTGSPMMHIENRRAL